MSQKKENRSGNQSGSQFVQGQTQQKKAQNKQQVSGSDSFTGGAGNTKNGGKSGT